MARNNRDILYEGTYYHIYNKVVTGVELFTEDCDYQEFLIRYANYFNNYFITYAYCLIPNHFHILVKVREESELLSSASKENTNASKAYINGTEDLNFLLESQFSRFFSGLSMKFNNRQNRTGPLFKQGVKRVALNKFRTFQQQLHYIHINPVHHGLVTSINNWTHSSYLSYLSDKKSQLPKEEVLGYFNGKQNFIDFHETDYLGDVIFD